MKSLDLKTKTVNNMVILGIKSEGIVCLSELMKD